LIEGILDYLTNNPPGAWAGPILFTIAFTETLFPPIPGDVLFVVLSGWAHSGGFSLALTVCCGVAGCVLASCLLFYLGHNPGRKFVDGWLSKKVDPERINRARSLISHHGPIVLAASRFLPGVRSLLVFMAGTSGMRFSVAAVPLIFSAVAWYLILSVAGSILGNNIQAAESFLHQFEVWIWIALAAVLLLFIAARIAKRKGKA